MSLAETQQIMADLHEIMEMLNSANVTSQKLEHAAPRIEQNEISLRKQIRTLDTALMLLQIAMGEKNVDRATKKIIQFTQFVYRGYIMVQALAAASGPWGWAYAIGNVATMTILTSQFAMS
jgi:hypothetical protein